MKSSPMLLKFYQAYAGLITVPGYTPKYTSGLCYNLHLFTKNMVNSDQAYFIASEMHDQFLAADLDLILPFNEDTAEYKREAKASKCWENPERKAWVYARIEEGDTL